MRITYLTLGCPSPDERGAQIRDYHLMSHVAAEHTVTLLCLVDASYEASKLTPLREIFESVEVFRVPGALTKAWSGLRSRVPLACWNYFSRPMVERMVAGVRREESDIVQVEHSHLAPFVDFVPPGPSTVLSLHNVGKWQYRSMTAMAGSRLERALWHAKGRLMERVEAHYTAKFDMNLTVSPLDRDRLLADVGDVPCEVIPNGVDLVTLQPLPRCAEGRSILFVGNLSYPPNADAVLHFADDIFDLVREAVPDARFDVVGPEPPAAVLRLNSRPGIEVHGAVPDVRPYYERATVCAVPLRAGGGTRLKILESMALGRPVVSTSVGCEGITVEDGVDIAIADEAPRFARAVIDLLQNDSAYESIAAKARQLVEAEYGWAALSRRLMNVYERLRASRGGEAHVTSR